MSEEVSLADIIKHDNILRGLFAKLAAFILPRNLPERQNYDYDNPTEYTALDFIEDYCRFLSEDYLRNTIEHLYSDKIATSAAFPQNIEKEYRTRIEDLLNNKNLLIQLFKQKLNEYPGIMVQYIFKAPKIEYYCGLLNSGSSIISAKSYSNFKDDLSSIEDRNQLNNKYILIDMLTKSFSKAAILHNSTIKTIMLTIFPSATDYIFTVIKVLFILLVIISFAILIISFFNAKTD